MGERESAREKKERERERVGTHTTRKYNIKQ